MKVQSRILTAAKCPATRKPMSSEMSSGSCPTASITSKEFAQFSWRLRQVHDRMTDHRNCGGSLLPPLAGEVARRAEGGSRTISNRSIETSTSKASANTPSVSLRATPPPQAGEEHGCVNSAASRARLRAAPIRFSRVASASGALSLFEIMTAVSTVHARTNLGERKATCCA